MERYEDVRTSTIALAGLIGALITFALIILLMVLYYQADARERKLKEIDEAPAEWANLKADQEGKLTSYRWVDPKNRLVAIPIDRAMDLVVAEVAATGHPKEIHRPKPPAAKDSPKPAAPKKP